MLKETAEIFRFKAGDVVPEWVVSQESFGPGPSIVEPIRFVVDAIVIDAPTAMFVCVAGGDPISQYRQTVGMFGLNSVGVRLVGTAKLVVTAAAWQFIFRFDQPVTTVSIEDALHFARGETSRLGPPTAVPPFEQEPEAESVPKSVQKRVAFDPFPSRRTWRERLTTAWLALFS